MPAGFLRKYKSRTRKRKPRRKGAHGGSSRTVMTIPKSLNLASDYKLVQWSSSVVQIANHSLTEEKVSFTYQLNLIKNYANYTNLFDQYRIKYVITTFTPVGATVINKPYDDTTTPGQVNLVPNIAICIDRDDATTSGTYDAIRARGGSRDLPMTKKIKFAFVPNKLKMVYRSGVTDAYVADTSVNDWIDCGQSDVPHYGLKCATESGSTNDSFVYDVQTKYFVEFRGRRD